MGLDTAVHLGRRGSSSRAKKAEAALRTRWPAVVHDSPVRVRLTAGARRLSGQAGRRHQPQPAAPTCATSPTSFRTLWRSSRSPATVIGTRPDAPAQGAPPVLASPLDTSPVLSLLHPLTAWSLHFSRGGSEYRIPEEDQIVFSHRFAPEKDGRLYSAQSNWGTFLDRCTELASPTKVTHVVVTDIADFYPRLYHHNIENALRDATGKSQHVPVLKKMISHWAEGEASYGLPIGPAGTRIIADVTINDVDETLRSEGATFSRFSDDYRIFLQVRSRSL